MKLSTLSLEGNFYKGNLHTHTTISDGKKSPEEMVELYKEYGYSFISITDHDVYGVHDNLNTEDFVVLPGIEMETTYKWKAPLYTVHHILGIGDPDKNKYTHGYKFDRNITFKMSPQEIIDELRANGNIAIYNHPHWSKAQFGDIVNLKGLNGMEIYNHNCESEWRCGKAEVFYDHLLWNNNIVWSYGTDDAHLHYNDFGGGYITVKAKELTRRTIFDALLEGSFYASAAAKGKMAPQIENFYVEDGVAKIFTSPSSKIYFMTGSEFLPIEDEGKNRLTYGEYKLPEDVPFVRAVCVDKYGYTSWTQPIILK